MELNREPRSISVPIKSIISDKGDKSIQWAKDKICNKWYWENWICAHTKK